MSDLQPYQAIRKLLADSDNVANVFVVACGPSLVTFRLQESGDSPSVSVISRWRPEGNDDTVVQDIGEPQQKKRKIDSSKSTHPDVIHLVTAPDHQHVVAVTGTDKCIRVFSARDGILTELSQRCMPKRPCAVQITRDGSTIVCADKFGDVYSLPLHPQTGETVPTTENKGDGKQKTYQPAADVTTVHSKRNLKVLHEQMLAKGKPSTSTKEPLAFEHKLLLGHVSMLTDLQLATVEIQGKLRDFIITCDRDEHIRVSRGIPHAHIIENFCLGHTEFIHRVRLIPKTTLLVSAGGDHWLGVWDWATGRPLGRKDLRRIRQASNSEKQSKDAPLAVRDVWLVNADEGSQLVIISCEGVDAIMCLEASRLLESEHGGTVIDCSTSGQIFDMVDVGLGRLLVSTQHHGLRTWTVRKATEGMVIDLHDQDNEALEVLNLARPPIAKVALDELMGGVEKLRKRDNEEE
ncbi:tRNA (guanine-N(7)-)-methyltransferase non-catalytic subunit trm82 [Sphaceloma murrayae]|uniref:tRNA (Guanine-N(7)-)-methyltransferase non-catalytic subunit trm82 n=1 Tax=Sphaceloma murrayae TaxID=2082308 RepID=A0A2K1QYQ0_9PEZI|nr:tRNA (guanine-N(7)-)-methyltransferase non-catalytic subunit trm82 [Sphaceloma murrayae]